MPRRYLSFISLIILFVIMVSAINPVQDVFALTPTVTATTMVSACTTPESCVAQMTLDEKIGQMTQATKGALSSPNDIATYYLGSLLSGGGEGPNGAGGTASQWADMYDGYQNIAITTRLRIPIIYGIDAVHGHSNVANAVLFPHHIGLGATRNAALVEQTEIVTRREVLGTGMNWAFAPTIAVIRDDRWGRTYEGYSEDTTVVSELGAAAIRGLQGSGLGPNTVLATAKHFVGDGGTTWGTGDNGYMIDRGNTQVSDAELRAIFLPPYRAAVDAGVGSVMASYSSWNGLKMHANKYLLTDVLKGELGFQGFVVSDWAGIDEIPGDYASDVRTSINAGVDMVMVPSDYKLFISTLRSEVNAGRVPMSRINDAVLRILRQKFATGLMTKYKTDRSYTSTVGSAEHRAIGRQAVRESLVLLKNEGSVLPLSKTATYKIVVGGSHADNLGLQSGGWSINWQGGNGAITQGTTFWQAIQAAKPAGVTLQNVGTNTNSSYSGDIGIAVVGEQPYAEGFGDSATLALSAANVSQVTDICARTTKCIVILMSGRPLIINSQLAQSKAFIAAWLPGTEGLGMTDVLFGDYNFTGKLPVTWPNSVSQEPINVGDGKVGLFPFGHGLSYNTGPTDTPSPTSTASQTFTPSPTSLPSELLSLNKPVTASSAESATYAAGLAVDGNLTTRWSSAFADPQWIQVDLGSVKAINRVLLNWEAAYGKDYQVQVSNDGTTWTTIKTVTGNTTLVNDWSVSASGRYVRIYGTARATVYGYSLYELSVYGPTGPTNTPTVTFTPSVTPSITQTATFTNTPSITPTSITPTPQVCGLLSANKPATASSTESATYAASMAVDGNTTSRWSSAFADPQWIQVDLGAVYNLCRVRLVWEAAYGKDYQIQTSSNGTTWTAIKNVFGNTALTNDWTVSGSARYVRIYGTARGTAYGYSLYELEVYGSTGPTITPSPTMCATGTAAPVFVDPVTSPTDQLSQVINVSAGPNAPVTVQLETGSFTGTYNSTVGKTQVTVPLLANADNHLRVSIRYTSAPGVPCPFDYVVSSTVDRFGAPLTIRQGTATLTPTVTPSITPSQVPSGACSVKYTVTGDWGGSFNADVTITNTGTSAINGWTLGWSFPGNQTITNLWNGTSSQIGKVVSATNVNWNGSIPANGSVTVGFSANYSGANVAPTSFTVNGAACTVTP